MPRHTTGGSNHEYYNFEGGSAEPPAYGPDKSIWNATLGDTLLCETEVGNVLHVAVVGPSAATQPLAIGHIP